MASVWRMLALFTIYQLFTRPKKNQEALRGLDKALSHGSIDWNCQQLKIHRWDIWSALCLQKISFRKPTWIFQLSQTPSNSHTAACDGAVLPYPTPGTSRQGQNMVQLQSGCQVTGYLASDTPVTVSRLKICLFSKLFLCISLSNVPYLILSLIFYVPLISLLMMLLICLHAILGVWSNGTPWKIQQL